jgi:hypothetical protein
MAMRKAAGPLQAAEPLQEAEPLQAAEPLQEGSRDTERKRLRMGVNIVMMMVTLSVAA